MNFLRYVSIILVTGSIALSSHIFALPSDMQQTDSKIISRAFEFRYVTDDPAADGETDFKGETEIFNTEQRVEFLRNWAEYGRRYFDDPELKQTVIHDDEVASAMSKLKKQPLPEVRQKIRLDDWKYLGYRDGQLLDELRQIQQWNQSEGVTIENKRLKLTKNSFTVTFPEQSWRTKFSWTAMVPDITDRVTFRLSDYVAVGFAENGRFFYKVDGVEMPAGSYTPGEFYHFEVEMDPDGGLTPDFGRTDVQASSEIAIDPDQHRYHQRFHPVAYAAYGWNFWQAGDNRYPQWISFELEDLRDLAEARLAFRRSDGRRYNFRLEVSADREQWIPVTDEMTSATDRWTEIAWDEPVRARYARVVFTGASGEYPAALSMAEFYDGSGRVLLAEDDPLQGKFNFSVNGNLLADYVSFSNPPDDSRSVSVSSMVAETNGTVILDHIWGVGYELVTGDDVRFHPFEIETFLDTDFSVRPDPTGFHTTKYDDSQWKAVPYRRYAHGGERRKEEALYLRRMVHVDAFERAVLNVETVRPSADIYINGRHVKQAGRLPERIDISEYLKPDKENLIAVRVDPYRVEQVRHHMSSDPWTGWYAGLMDIELTDRFYIDDVFAYATEVSDPARLQLEVQATSESRHPFRGQLLTRIYPWYPVESEIVAGESTRPLSLEAGETVVLTDEIRIPDPKLWTTRTPNLYKVHVVIQDEAGNDIDDYILTTGLRTISQDGGTFRINGRPEMLNGPLLFGHHAPLERIAQWMFSPPKERWVHDILLAKKMNGNTLRMSVHDQRLAGVNDRRLAQIGDQMGIMFMWQTPSWVREGPAFDLDFEGLPIYAKQVRNHPSIVMWQPGNHPAPWPMEWFQKVYDTLSEVDRSRLISPSADMSRMDDVFDKTIGDTWRPADDDTTWSSWTSPLIARGTMEQVLAYGQDWHYLRNFPGMHGYRGMEREARMEYLNSETHAWFDFESEETIGQANWNLTRGKPYHKLYSYEMNYDVGSIGRKLDFDEWRASQAWQALSLYEAYRKKRWLGFDGMNWCPMRGGGNTATYMKPMLDYENHPKLAFYAHKMVFQPVLAGSKNVDIAYGPNDEIPVIVLNLGKARTVDVVVQAKNMDGKILDKIIFEAVELPDGKGLINLGDWKPDLPEKGYYGFEYLVLPGSSGMTE